MNKRFSAVLAPVATVLDYVINESIVKSWVDEKNPRDVCPISGQAKHPAHYINKLEFEQLEAMQKGLGAQATYAVRGMYIRLLSSKAPAKKEQLPDIIAIKTDAEKYLGIYPEASRAELEKALDETFNIKCGAKAIAGNVYRTHHLRIVGEKFVAWITANPQFSVLPKEKIVEEFSQQNVVRENAFNHEAILIKLEKLETTKAYKDLIRTEYDKIVSNWIKVNGFDAYTPRAVQRIVSEPVHATLDAVELEFIYSRHKKLIKDAQKAESAKKQINGKINERERFYQLHVDAVKKHDDGILNSHEMARKIMTKEADVKSFATLVKAIIEVRNDKPKVKAFQKPLPNRMHIKGQSV